MLKPNISILMIVLCIIVRFKNIFQIVNYGASTSKSFTNTSSEIDDKTASKKTSESSKIFNKVRKKYLKMYFFMI